MQGPDSVLSKSGSMQRLTCRARTAARWRAQLSGPSTWPNMMVEVVGRPTPCAVAITCT
jgi:hypothetical protein